MSIPATPDQQRHLLALQACDTQIARLRRRAAAPPEQRTADSTAEALRAVAGEVTVIADELAARRAAVAQGQAGAALALEQAEARFDEARRRGEDLAARHRAALAAAPGAAAAVQEELAAVHSRRAILAAAVEEGLREVYEAARARSGDPVVVPVLADGTCGGCHLAIPALQLDDVRRLGATTLSRCPECDRYLVVG